MKNAYIIAITFSTMTAAFAAFPVVDLAAVTQRERLHAQTFTELRTISQNQRLQLEALQQQVTELQRLNRSVGDPSLVTALPGAQVLAASVAVSAPPALSLPSALSDTGGGVFAAVGEQFATLDGTTVSRDPQNYASVAAMVASRAQLEMMFTAASQRREQLRQAARETHESLRVATTLVDIQKLQGVLAALHLELDATDRDAQFAAQRLQVQALDNQNDLQRQALARQEEQAAEIRLALKRLTETLRPNTKPAPFRSSR